MDELENARLKRLSRQLGTTGWASDPQSMSANPVKFWIYSCSLERGPRLITQLGADFYRDLVAGTGPFELLQKQFPEPERDLPGMLGLFDMEAGDGRHDWILQLHLTMVLALYATNTEIWGKVRPLEHVDGIHFMIFDWLVQDFETRIFRPVHIYHDKPILEQDLLDLQGRFIEMHLEKRPQHEPLRARPWNVL